MSKEIKQQMIFTLVKTDTVGVSINDRKKEEDGDSRLITVAEKAIFVWLKVSFRFKINGNIIKGERVFSYTTLEIYDWRKSFEEAFNSCLFLQSETKSLCIKV